MKHSAKNITTVVLAVCALLVLVAAGVLWSGVYSFAADAPHSAPVSAVIEFARERSVKVRADDIAVPQLAGPERALKGAGNYQAMCAQCHLSPGQEATELSRGLYPAPPRLARRPVDPAAAFWTIKHGIKATGMPAWGASMQDADIWNLVAFLRVLPSLDQAGYRALVERSGGHAHGAGPGPEGGESHGAGEPDAHAAAAGADAHGH